MSYVIKHYTYNQARNYGVIVKPSKNPKKKIDVFDKFNHYLCSAGDSKFNDFPTYLEMERKGQVPTGYAEERRRLYRIRHNKETKHFGSPSWASWNLLW